MTVPAVVDSVPVAVKMEAVAFLVPLELLSVELALALLSSSALLLRFLCASLRPTPRPRARATASNNPKMMASAKGRRYHFLPSRPPSLRLGGPSLKLPAPASAPAP